MNGDVYRLREELLERIEGIEQALALLEARPACQCQTKTPAPKAGAVVGEIRSASVD